MSGERTDRIRETREEIQLPMEEEEAERRIAMVKPPFAERELRFEVGDELLAGFCEGRETGLKSVVNMLSNDAVFSLLLAGRQ